jgi:hypothetical protein
MHSPELTAQIHARSLFFFFTDWRIKYFSYQILPDFRKNTALPEFPRFRPFVLLVIAIFIKRWVWSIGGITLTGENQVLGEKPVPVPLRPPQISHGLNWDRNKPSAVRGRRLSADIWKSVRTSQRIQFASTTKTNQLIRKGNKRYLLLLTYETNNILFALTNKCRAYECYSRCYT